MIVLRDVVMLDADLVLEWVNDPVARSMSFRGAVVERNDHLLWLENRINDDQTLFWIGEIASEPFGLVRFAVRDGAAEITSVISPTFRGRGLASLLFSAGIMRLAASRSDVKVVWGIAKPENNASIRTFERIGFVRSDRVQHLGCDGVRFEMLL